ncbi:hypothetical protein JCM8097_001245 [Rhodosporidiobolus ruineniae]
MLGRPATALRTLQRTCTCAPTRAFASFAPLASPQPSSSAPAPRRVNAQADKEQAASRMDELLNIVKEVQSAEPLAEEVENPSAVLRHLSRHQTISPQHLSPRALLRPYPPQPNFSQAFPLGPPTSFGPTHDPFVRYGIDPLDPKQGAMNPWIASEFVTSMGKIKPRGKTGLQRKSQRRVGKAIRRARSMGIIPTFGISLPSNNY